jgi:glycosyltransferase involved in cell wall biosynthesis
MRTGPAQPSAQDSTRLEALTIAQSSGPTWSQPRWSGQRPRVSVIVPTYNRATFLERTIESIFAQSVTVDEVLLVDDGSTDETRAMVERLRAAHLEWTGRCQYLWQEHQGKSVALNTGLQIATGDWIAFNDSDDLWRPEKLELQFRALGQFESAGACFTDACFVNHPSMKETAFELALPDRTSLFGIRHDIATLYASTSQPIYMQTLIVSRDVMRAFGEFDPTFLMGMDTDLAFRLGLLTPMCYVNAPLVEIDRTEHRTIGLMTEFPFHSIDRLHVHERMIARWIEMTKASHPQLRPRLRDRLSLAQNVLANHYLAREDFQTARSILGRAVRSSRRPNMVAKFVWSMIAPRSLRKEIVRRNHL